MTHILVQGNLKFLYVVFSNGINAK